jgi:hypothetical protein
MWKNFAYEILRGVDGTYANLGRLRYPGKLFTWTLNKTVFCATLAWNW